MRVSNCPETINIQRWPADTARAWTGIWHIARSLDLLGVMTKVHLRSLWPFYFLNNSCIIGAILIFMSQR